MRNKDCKTVPAGHISTKFFLAFRSRVGPTNSFYWFVVITTKGLHFLDLPCYFFGSSTFLDFRKKKHVISKFYVLSSLELFTFLPPFLQLNFGRVHVLYLTLYSFRNSPVIYWLALSFCYCILYDIYFFFTVKRSIGNKG